MTGWLSLVTAIWAALVLAALTLLAIDSAWTASSGWNRRRKERRRRRSTTYFDPSISVGRNVGTGRHP